MSCGALAFNDNALKLFSSAIASEKTKSSTEAQTDHTMKVDQAVTTAHDLSTMTQQGTKKGKKKKEPKEPAVAKRVHRCEACDLKRNARGCEACADKMVDGVNGHKDAGEAAEEAGETEDAVQAAAAAEVDEIAAVTKVNGVEGSPKKKKPSKKKAKAKQGEANTKRDAEGLDSTRTSADVSEIASADEAGGSPRKSKKKPEHSSKVETVNDENEENGETDDRQHAAYRTQSAYNGHNKKHVDHESDVMSEPGVRVQHIKSIRQSQGSGSDLGSSEGGPGGRSSGGYPPSKATAAIDRFRVDWESSLRSSVQRYAEEKRIFQELANLKRLQIQYGSVQEEVIVRRLIDDFLRGYNVRTGDFQVSTFNSWEKFLYGKCLSLLSVSDVSRGRLRLRLSLFRPTEDIVSKRKGVIAADL